MQLNQPILAKDGIALLGAKTVVASGMDSHDWHFRVPTAFRLRSFWSATVQDARFLQGMKDFLMDFLQENREEVTLPDGSRSTALKVGSKAQFIQKAREWALANGLDQAIDPKDRGTIKDITSEQRLGLIFEVQTQTAWNYTRWMQGQSPAILNEYPADEFVRVVEVKQERPLHTQNEGTIRLKTDLDFWLQMNSPNIGGFGVPWGPWGFNSGMGVRDVDRDRAEKLGLIGPKDVLKPIHKDFNERLEAGTKNLDPEILAWLKAQLGDLAEVEGNSIRWVGGDAGVPQRKAPPTAPPAVPPAATPAPTPSPKPTPAPAPAPGRPSASPATPNRTPTTPPVSDALDLRIRDKIQRDKIQTAISVIDSVHSDGVLPTIPVDSTVHGLHSLGEFSSDISGRANRIGVKAGGPWPELTFVHEVGHFLDLAGLGTRDFASKASQEMQDWKKAVEASKALEEIKTKVRGRNREYLLRSVELWARAYAQWIVIQSGNPILLEQLNAIRSGPMSYRQWSDADFEPIAAAISALFRAKGWIK